MERIEFEPENEASLESFICERRQKLKRLGFLELNDVLKSWENNSLEEVEQKAGQESAPVVDFVNSVIKKAVKYRASDIHLEPGEKGARIRFRIDGILREIETISPKFQNPVVSRIKIMSGLDIANKRLPQDGHFNYPVNGYEIDIRVSTFPTVYGEKIVLRLLDKKQNLLRLEELGFTDQILKDIQQLLKKAHGMILVTGPTGSGKTTTLYGLINKFNSTQRTS